MIKNDAQAPDCWVADVSIKTRTDEPLYWDPVQVQMEVNQSEEALWR